MLTIRDETFNGLYPFTPHYYSHHGIDIHYVDEGSGEPVVMVHGDPTWGFLSHNIIVVSFQIIWAWVSHLSPRNAHCTGLSNIAPTSKRSSWTSIYTTLPSFCTIGEDL